MQVQTASFPLAAPARDKGSKSRPAPGCVGTSVGAQAGRDPTSPTSPGRAQGLARGSCSRGDGFSAGHWGRAWKEAQETRARGHKSCQV